MGQRSIRFPDELEARLVALAESDGRSFSNFVIRSLEATLGGLGPGTPRGAVSSPRRGPGPSKETAPTEDLASSQDSSGVRDESAGAAAPVARVVAPAGSSPARPPKPVPTVRRAREFVLDPRQAALNKAKKA